MSLLEKRKEFLKNKPQSKETVLDKIYQDFLEVLKNKKESIEKSYIESGNVFFRVSVFDRMKVLNSNENKEMKQRLNKIVLGDFGIKVINLYQNEIHHILEFKIYFIESKWNILSKIRSWFR